jgi:hypothetical protein
MQPNPENFLNFQHQQDFAPEKVWSVEEHIRDNTLTNLRNIVKYYQEMIIAEREKLDANLKYAFNETD